jgi:4-amino-4-deoxychorismate lyase
MRFQLITDLDDNASGPLQDRALHYGDGLFETMLMREGQIALWQHHYERLRDSAAKLSIGCPQQLDLERALDGYRALGKDQIIKLILSRGCSGRGLVWPRHAEPVVYLLSYPFDPAVAATDIRAVVLDEWLPLNPKLAGLKHLNRLDYVLASEQLARLEGFNEALLCDQQGYLVEGLVHNLFFTLDAELHTPELDRCGVAGVMRAGIIKKLKAVGKRVTIGRYRQQDILRASAVVYCNSVHGIRPVTCVDSTSFDSRPLVNELQALFHAAETA